MSMIVSAGRVGGGGGGGSSDPSFANVALLLGANGADGSTAFNDEGPSGHVLTANGNAQIDVARRKFGSGAALFDGAGDYITAPHHADFVFGTGAFTIEAWANFATIGDFTIVDKWAGFNGTSEWAFYGAAGTLYFRFYDVASVLYDTTYAWAGRATDTWYHLCAERSAAGNLRLYIDGVMVAKAARAQEFRIYSFPLSIGANYSQSNLQMNGALDELRITKGVARYASDAGFAVPTAAFPRN